MERIKQGSPLKENQNQNAQGIRFLSLCHSQGPKRLEPVFHKISSLSLSSFNPAPSYKGPLSDLPLQKARQEA